MIDALRPITLAGAAPKPPVVLLHGFMGDPEDWRPVADALGDRHHVLAVSLPGHGPDWQGVAIGELDMAACAAGIVDHLDALGLERPALAGYSLGGRVALFLAMHYPKKIGRLILESASPGLDTAEKRENRQAQDRILAERLANLAPGSHGFRAFLEEWYAMPLFSTLQRDPASVQALIERRVHQCAPGLVAQSLHTLGTGSQPDLWPKLDALTVPTLAIAGELDRKFRIIAEDMARACPAMAVEILSGCGHNVHLEHPDAFVTVVRAFLNPAAS